MIAHNMRMSRSTPIDTDPANHPDRFALSRIGMQFRRRMAQDPEIVQIAAGKAEIWTKEAFLSEEECARLIDMIDRVARPSTVLQADEEDENKHHHRTSYSGNVDPHDPIVRDIQRRIDDVLGIDPEFGETIQGQRYAEGQEYRTHFDWFRPESSYWPRQQQLGGQRSVTAMVFLNSVEAGGTTDFPSIGLSIPPRRGALVVWNNATSEGLPNKWTLHAGRPVERGVKYIITKWYRARKWG